MIDRQAVIRRLAANAQAMRALVETISAEQAQWKPDPDTWSMTEVMSHVYNEERVDFRAHLKEMFSRPPAAWGALPEPWLPQDDCQCALKAFLGEREASLAWLEALTDADWDAESRTVFGDGQEIVLRAGDVLLSWIEHDFLHLRQMIELHYAWVERQAAPYGVEYAGGW